MIGRFLRINKAGARWLEKQFPSVFSNASYVPVLNSAIQNALSSGHVKVLLEAGGVDRPFMRRSADYAFVGLDIDERPDCHRVYDRFVVQSIETPLSFTADMIISVTLLEHVPHNDAAVGSMFSALTPGGTTHHYIPSKWHPYAIALRIVGSSLQKKLISLLRPEAVDLSGYPTFFDHCSPKAMETLFKVTGFQKVELTAFYSASEYFSFFLPAYIAVGVFEHLCRIMDWKLFASGFVISGSKGSSASISESAASS